MIGIELAAIGGGVVTPAKETRNGRTYIYGHNIEPVKNKSKLLKTPELSKERINLAKKERLLPLIAISLPSVSLTVIISLRKTHVDQPPGEAGGPSHYAVRRPLLVNPI